MKPSTKTKVKKLAKAIRSKVTKVMAGPRTVSRWNGKDWAWCPQSPLPDAVNALVMSGKTGEVETGDGKYRVK